jgi:hypothetical protein
MAEAWGHSSKRIKKGFTRKGVAREMSLRLDVDKKIEFKEL